MKRSEVAQNFAYQKIDAEPLRRIAATFLHLTEYETLPILHPSGSSDRQPVEDDLQRIKLQAGELLAAKEFGTLLLVEAERAIPVDRLRIPVDEPSEDVSFVAYAPPQFDQILSDEASMSREGLTLIVRPFDLEDTGWDVLDYIAADYELRGMPPAYAIPLQHNTVGLYALKLAA